MFFDYNSAMCNADRTRLVNHHNTYNYMCAKLYVC